MTLLKITVWCAGSKAVSLLKRTKMSRRYRTLALMVIFQTLLVVLLKWFIDHGVVHTFVRAGSNRDFELKIRSPSETLPLLGNSLNDSNRTMGGFVKTFYIVDLSGYILDSQLPVNVDNCVVTRDLSMIDSAHAVTVTLPTMHRLSDKDIGFIRKRHKPSQRWIAILDESNSNWKIKDLVKHNVTDVFNWTMTYNADSDIPIPYGYTIRRKFRSDVTDYYSNKTKLVGAVISNCRLFHNDRLTYIAELQKSIPVTVYGYCGRSRCSSDYSKGLPSSSCPEMRKHLFYLAFENTNCMEYITEKPFLNGLAQGAVPVVLGARKRDYQSILPPNSFIYVKDFDSPKSLADYLKKLASNETAYMEFHQWRKDHDFIFRNQHTDNSVWISLCQKMNSDDGAHKVYTNLHEWLGPSKRCQPEQHDKLKSYFSFWPTRL